MGLAYGDIFNHLIVIAGGRMNPIRRKGKPKIFIAHGTGDQVMPIELSGRPFSARLKQEGTRSPIASTKADMPRLRPSFGRRSCGWWAASRSPA